jgi:hypothetical protein
MNPTDLTPIIKFSAEERSPAYADVGNVSNADEED